ncbi:dihydrolipoyl dehydrogenase family protein [Mangrovicella endophytica]|uniref:dihydrolipoyl dehydrogenase family protein n=1 Tax=Mangrovicella endophytica TaxID=2066697 RepID=UPI000C9E5DE0|nr:FAD-dependent oxidoreductase [Mangrovicella endophytica]
MTRVLTPDICVIGAGAAGLTVAAAAASFGVDVVLIERGTMGGECLNSGCVPSKALIAAARQAQAIRDAGRFGITAGEPSIDFAAVRAHVSSAIAAIAPMDSAERFRSLGVTVLKASARFVDADTVEADGIRIRARRFVIATGSRPHVPDIPGLSALPYLTNETLFDLEERPDHLLILGGGPIGIEMAQAFRRLGSKVTVIEPRRALGRDDAELSAVALARLRAEGVVVLEQTRVTAAEQPAEGGIRLSVDGDGDGCITGTHLLVATGRDPVTEDLHLAVAGIQAGPSGIVTGPDLRTGNRRVYAIGDCTDGPRFTHAAGQQAGLVVRTLLFRLPVRYHPSRLPRVTYTEPELGYVGLTEAEAAAQGLTFSVERSPFTHNDRAQAEGQTDGLVKLILGRRGQLLGAGVVGVGAGEMINLFSLALSQRLGASALAGFVSPYPSLADAGKRAATAHFQPYAHRPAVRRIVSLLARLG